MRDWLRQIESGPRDPLSSARASLRRDLPKRFYKAVAVEPQPAGFAVHLDGKPLHTPGRRPLLLPTAPAAELVAAEWRAVAERIDPAAMPYTRLSNTAIDGVASDIQAVIEEILRFCASDLLCYRAESPQGLAEAQARLWDPVLAWLSKEHDADFVVTRGIQHVTQPKSAIAAFSQSLRRYADPIPMTCLHVMTTLTGSAMLALAVAENRLDAAQAWAAAHVDEDWNIARWGQDEEAKVRRNLRWIEMEAAAHLLKAF